MDLSYIIFFLFSRDAPPLYAESILSEESALYAKSGVLPGKRMSHRIVGFFPKENAFPQKTALFLDLKAAGAYNFHGRRPRIIKKEDEA